MHTQNTNFGAFDYKAWRNTPGIYFSCVKYNFLVPWPCHWRWSPAKCSTHENSTVRRGGQSWYVLFRIQGRRARIQEWAACTTDQWWQITSRPLDEKTFQGTLWWDEVAAITTVTFWKLTLASIQAPSQRSTAFHRRGTQLLTPVSGM